MKSLYPHSFRKAHVLGLIIILLSLSNVRAATYVVTTTNATGAGSLAAAIAAANSTATSDVITFNISGTGPHTIDFNSADIAPTQITAAGGGLLIDGFSQPGASGCNLKIRINGRGGWDAWTINGASNVTLRGLSLTNLYVNINGGGNNRIYGCYFDITPAGTLVNDGSTNSLYIQNNSTGNIIGGLGCNFRNVFAGAGERAIFVSASTNNTIVGNYIGTSLSGNSLSGSFNSQGIYVSGVSSGIRIDSNVIVGCKSAGILTSAGTTNNIVIRGNYVGIRADGVLNGTDYGNGLAGIYLNANANGVTIDGNVVCDNGGEVNLASHSGIFIYSYGTTISNIQVTNNNVGVGPAPGYVPKGNDFAGIYLQGTGGTISNATISGNVVGDNGDNPHQKSSGIATLDIPNSNIVIYNNYIGMTPEGADRGNYHNGIEISNTSRVTIGGTGANQRNYIGYNKALRPNTTDPYGAGILVTSTPYGTSNNIDIINNYIGVQPDGITSAPQVTTSGAGINSGIVVENSVNVRIGGTSSNQSNIIANCGGHGVDITGGSDYVQIRRNSIYCNGIKGINLNLQGVPGNASFAAPVIDINSITANSVSGTCPSGAIVEIYYDADGSCARACENPNKRQGKVYLGTAVTTGTTWTYTHTSNFTGNLTATATGGCTGANPANCRTSEFATCVYICTNATAPGSLSVDRNNICADDDGNITLTANGGSGHTFRWYTGSCGGTLVGSATSITIPSPATTTTYYGRWEAATGCSNSSCLSVTVSVSAVPSTASAGNDIELCNATTATLSAVAPTPATASGKWTVISGSANITDPTNPASEVTDLGFGVITLRWTVSNGACANSSYDEVEIKNYSKPVASVGSTQTTTCSSSTMLPGLNLSSGAGVWTIVGHSTANIADPTVPSSVVNDLPVGKTVFRWTISNGTCGSAWAEVEVVRNEPTEIAYAGLDTTVKCTSAITLKAGNANGKWSVASGAGTFVNPYDPNTQVLNLSPGVNKFYWSVSGACGVSTDSIEVTYSVSDIVVSASAASDIVCAGTARDLQVEVSGGSGDFTFEWYSSDNRFNVTSKENTVSAVPYSSSVTYYVVARDNVEQSCVSNVDSVTVYSITRQELIIPNLITPNGDAMNDALVIRDVNEVDLLPGATLEVYNRWGQRVYSAENYDNTWKAETLSDGMYFYHLETGCGKESYKGWLHVLNNINN
ncbi:MAG TPA: gliding motility-associated C-terminal domain-containing protein [Cytophagaceae bacterium]